MPVTFFWSSSRPNRKQQGDSEAVSQHAMSTIRTCEIQDIQHRKPGPSLPTLLITFENDPAADKARKRRSSRSSGMSSSSAFPNSLLFRTQRNESYNIGHWHAKIKPHVVPSYEDRDAPVSPASPMANAFINPFASRPGKERPQTRAERHHRVSSNTYVSAQSVHSREPDPTSTLISPSPSLRSRSSNISSSQASSFGRSQNYHPVFPIQQLPAELPSPTSPQGYDDQSILGRTSAQGRSSALSSHTRASNSISVTGSPAAAPRETILDRAFMMRCIPGSERVPFAEDGGKLSSIARFEALMREADERRLVKATNTNRAAPRSLKNGSELEEELSGNESVDEDDEAEYGEGMEYGDEINPLSLSVQEIPTPAQRALEYISGRAAPSPFSARAKLSSIQSPTPQIPRSRTSPPKQGKQKERPKSLLLPSTLLQSQPASQNLEIPDHNFSANVNRRSSASTKRLSFTEFAKRLSSSTSSLLLVQTNASSGSGASMSATASSRLSSEGSFADNGIAAEENMNSSSGTILLQRGLSQRRHSGMGKERSAGGRGTGGSNTREMTRGERGEMGPLGPPGLACGWRGSGLGVLGTGEARLL